MRSFTLGTIQGIEIKTHPTMALVLLWALYRWGFGPGGGLTGAAYGLLFVAAIFGLVLLHELGHGLMARQYGLAVRDVTLLPFGGVARVEQMPASTRVETLVAMAGSLVNLAIAMVTLPIMLVLFVLSDTSFSQLFQRFRFDTPSFGSFVLYLYLANLLLALVNLLPIFPMDGGRVLRSVLTEFVGRANATRIAVFVTALIAAIAGAIALANGEWLMTLVFLMLVLFALAEGRAVRLEEHLRRMEVGHFAVWDRGGIAPNEPLAIALRDGPRDMVVTAHGAVLGMIWKSDLQRALQSGMLHKTASEIMDRSIVTADVESSVYDVHSMMAANNQWSLPITEHGAYRGMFDGERLSHVHTMLRSRTPEHRHLTTITGSLSQALRGFVR
ncbi:MAG: site-2 protease family protein [Thermomicrobiales bacterium]|nr:site-2 protease family protein [Thermomicrobiales bacterium]